MNLKSLIILIIAVVIGGVIYHISSKPKDSVATTNILLIPSLSENLNNVNKLIVHEVGNSILTSLSKAEKMWIVENRDGYEANISAIRKVFNDLSDAKIIEEKTSNPENYSKLHVEDINQPNAQGVLFSIEGLDEPVKIIAGTDGSSNNTQYIRRAGEKQTWLIDKKLNLNRDVTLWLRKDLLDIPPERIKDISIQHLDGSVLQLENRGKQDYEFILINEIPEGKEIFESEIYQVANALSSLELRDVAAVSSLDVGKEKPVITTFKTFDGLTIAARTYPNETQSYTVFDIQFNEEDVVEIEPIEGDDIETAIISDPVAAKKLAKEVQLKVEGWAYQLPTITQEALVKNLENFILDGDNS